MLLWEVGEHLGDGSNGGELGYWGHVLEGVIWAMTPSFLATMKGAGCSYNILPNVVLATTGPKQHSQVPVS